MKKKFKNFFQILNQRGLFILFKSIVNLITLIFIRDILKKEKIIKKVNNYKMILMTNDRGISRSLTLFGTREEDKKYILNKILTENMSVFDIGANIGYYTIFFAKKLREGQILAIEPSLENIKLCKENIDLNYINKKKITFLQAGVSNKNSSVDFFLSKQSNLHTLNPDGSAKEFLTGKKIKIKTFSIKSLSQKYFTPNLIRMDVEGHECEIISGMLCSIKKKLRPHICFEPHIDSYSKNNNFAQTLSEIFKLKYYTNMLSSNAEHGTTRIMSLIKKKPEIIIPSDGEKRGIFFDLNPEDTIKILTKIGGARTVLLSPKN